MARAILSKMAASLGPHYLHLFVLQLGVTLNKGYQLHIRSWAIHSLLLVVTMDDGDAPAPDVKPIPSLDASITSLMTLIQKDLFRSAAKMKEVVHMLKKILRCKNPKAGSIYLTNCSKF